MKKNNVLLVFLITALLFVTSSLIHKNEICCMFASFRAYGFPGQYLVISKETDSLIEAQKIYSSTAYELLKQGWKIKFSATMFSPVSQSAFFNLIINLFICFIAAGSINYFLNIFFKKFKKR